MTIYSVAGAAQLRPIALPQWGGGAELIQVSGLTLITNATYMSRSDAKPSDSH